MLDIIIPVYNDIHNLTATLNSLTTITYPFSVYIIDDCSTHNVSQLNEIINNFSQFFSINCIHLPENMGPGMARQKGIEISSNEFIYFLDCGDIIINGELIAEPLQNMSDNQYLQILLFEILEEWEPGKYMQKQDQCNLKNVIIKRQIIEEFNIQFYHSYYFEDIGFRKQICIISRDKNNPYSELQLSNPIIVQTWDKNSLTKKNNSEDFYIHMIDFAYNHIFALNNIKTKISSYMFDTGVYEALICTYINYIDIKTSRPQYLPYIIETLKLIINTYFQNKNFNNTHLHQVYNILMSQGDITPQYYPFFDFVMLCKSLI